MKNFRLFFISFILLLITGTKLLMAHPGHGATDGHSLIHYLTEPMHATILIAVIIMILSSATWLILRKRKKGVVEVNH